MPRIDSRRRFLTACALAASAALPALAWAERFPERPVSFVVPFRPAGPRTPWRARWRSR